MEYIMQSQIHCVSIDSYYVDTCQKPVVSVKSKIINILESGMFLVNWTLGRHKRVRYERQNKWADTLLRE
jgi:hypothetical protein